VGDSGQADENSGTNWLDRERIRNRGRSVRTSGLYWPLTQPEATANARKAGHDSDDWKLGYYDFTYAWVLEKTKRLQKPVGYRHPTGAIIWVQLEASVERQVWKQI
jgi:hypothetical protein